MIVVPNERILDTSAATNPIGVFTICQRQSSNVSRHLSMRTGNDKNTLSFHEIVFLGTLGNAQVLDLDTKIGNLEQGKEFDALLMDVGGTVLIMRTGRWMIWRW